MSIPDGLPLPALLDLVRIGAGRINVGVQDELIARVVADAQVGSVARSSRSIWIIWSSFATMRGFVLPISARPT